MSSSPIHLLDYGAGNILSVRNAIIASGYPNIVDIASPDTVTQLASVPNSVIVFPGVGNFDGAMRALAAGGYIEPLQAYISSNNNYFGICLGMQTLFQSSEECPGVPGLGLIPGTVDKFVASKSHPVPCIGWNSVTVHPRSETDQTDEAQTINPNNPNIPNILQDDTTQKYFVHSYNAPLTSANADWCSTTTTYGSQTYISSIQKGNVFATQFHPEKSGVNGIQVIRKYLDRATGSAYKNAASAATPSATTPSKNTKDRAHGLTKRVIAALDVRSNDKGDLIVTKGDQYDVRETSETNAVRNLGLPASLAERYYNEGIDEIAFLNITSFRSNVLEDLPLLDLLQVTAKTVFVPLTVGGGIRSIKDDKGNVIATAADVADKYFRAGADKVSIGSDAVYSVEQLIANDYIADGSSSIEQIAHMYGVQAVVVSIDPKRVYLNNDAEERAARDDGHTIVTEESGKKCWYQCTVSGGREARNIDAVALAKGVEKLGCGELMVNCIDNDGQGDGFNHLLLNAVCDNVTIPVIASSGAGSGQHFVDVFEKTGVSAALAAGIFHRREVGIDEVKRSMEGAGIPARGI
jgi:glutamine amidotransferase/cyclase